MNRALTTSQVAEICNVSIRTVATWVDKGLLKGHRVPPKNPSKNAGRRHIMENDLYAFMEEHGMMGIITKRHRIKRRQLTNEQWMQAQSLLPIGKPVERVQEDTSWQDQVAVKG